MMIGRFLRDERGSFTIEFVLWVPLFAFLLMVASDASFMYLTVTRMENAARDAVRQVSIGRLDSATVQTYVAGGLDAGPYNVSLDCSTSEVACITITRPVASIVTFNVFSSLLGQSIGAETRMRLEPGVSL
jgi:Flp pilus assembly protein TadG